MERRRRGPDELSGQRATSDGFPSGVLQRVDSVVEAVCSQPRPRYERGLKLSLT